jgi:hypothetical protein
LEASGYGDSDELHNVFIEQNPALKGLKSDQHHSRSIKVNQGTKDLEQSEGQIVPVALIRANLAKAKNMNWIGPYT